MKELFLLRQVKHFAPGLLDGEEFLYNFELKVFCWLATVLMADVGVMMLLGFGCSGCSGLVVGTELMMMMLEVVVVVVVVRLEVVVVLEVVMVMMVVEDVVVVKKVVIISTFRYTVIVWRWWMCNYVGVVVVVIDIVPNVMLVPVLFVIRMVLVTVHVLMVVVVVIRLL